MNTPVEKITASQAIELIASLSPDNTPSRIVEVVCINEPEHRQVVAAVMKAKKRGYIRNYVTELAKHNLNIVINFEKHHQFHLLNPPTKKALK
jgi:hypothetical protein